MIMNEMEASLYADLIRRLERERDDVEARIDMLKDELKDYMKSLGVSSVKAGNFKVYWTEYEMHRFDTKAFKKDNPDLYNKYEVSSKTRRFSIV